MGWVVSLCAMAVVCLVFVHWRYSYNPLTGVLKRRTLVFVYVYNCTLVSFLAMSYKSPEINSFQDLADSSTYQVVTLRGTASETVLLVIQNDQNGSILSLIK